jgi:hypothetical protein
MANLQRDTFSPGPLSPRLDGSHTNHEWMRKGPPGRYPARRESTASLASSVGGSLDVSIQGRMNKTIDTGKNGKIGNDGDLDKC